MRERITNEQIYEEIIRQILTGKRLPVASGIIHAFLSGSQQHGAMVPGKSDQDITGVYLEPPETVIGLQMEKGFVAGTNSTNGKNTVDDIDLTFKPLREWARLACKGNPTVLGYAFTHAQIEEPRFHNSVWYTDILPNINLFASSRHGYAFLGYGQAQLQRLKGERGTGRHGQRQGLEQEFGYDCYVESETEFLTKDGWKKFDDISDKVGSIDITTGNLIWNDPIQRIDKLYSGNIYELESNFSSFAVTAEHNLLVSPARRQTNNNFTTKFFPEKAQWELRSVKEIKNGIKYGSHIRSYYHMRQACNKQMIEFDIDDDYLKLLGFFISEGSILFRKGYIGKREHLKEARFCQTTNGKEEFFKEADSLISKFSLIRKTYRNYETIWRIPKNLSLRLFDDAGHYSKEKRLPKWVANLSYRQAEILYHALCLGDGTRNHGSGWVYGSANRDLINDIHLMLVISGHISNMNGPYDVENCPMWTIHRPDKQEAFLCAYLKSDKVLRKRYTENERVVCFTMPAGTLITRRKGQVSIQGNCKAGMHMIRMMFEGIEYVSSGRITYPRPEVETLLEIRKGKWSEDQVVNAYREAEFMLGEAIRNSPLPPEVNYDDVNHLLANVYLKSWNYAKL